MLTYFDTQSISTCGKVREDIRVSRNVVTLPNGGSFRAVRLGDGRTRYSAVGLVTDNIGAITVYVPPEIEGTPDEVFFIDKIKKGVDLITSGAGKVLDFLGGGGSTGGDGTGGDGGDGGDGGNGPGGQGGQGGGCEIDVSNLQNNGILIIQGCGGSGGSGGDGNGGDGGSGSGGSPA